MSRYPKSVRAASVKCVECNAPVVRVVDGTYGCVKCGQSPVKPRPNSDEKPSAGENTGVAGD